MFSSNSSQVSGAANYIEDVFSTYLYTGNSSTQTITNNIDLSTYGGLVWTKQRNYTGFNILFDSARSLGFRYSLYTNTTGAELDNGLTVLTPNSTGYSINNGGGYYNGSPDTYVSWTFREQAKFFDVVTYTGTGSNTTIAHSLGAVPGSIIVKRTDTTADWAVYHRSLANTQYLVLNSTATAATGATWWNSTTPTSTVFSVGTDASVNASGGTYVAYVFAHDAGGFGLAGTDNVISCGIFTTDASGGCNVNLGYEPQWILSKSSTIAVPWAINDTMRGFTSNNTNNSNLLDANTSGAEYLNSYLEPTSTGFKSSNQLQASAPYIYIAIRRGPMKVPTVGTSVYNAQIRTGNNSAVAINGAGFPPDLILSTTTDTTVGPWFIDKLRGIDQGLTSASTAAEVTDAGNVTGFSNIGFSAGSGAQGWTNGATYNYVYQFFQRAPGFFDEVCYTGTGSATTVTHNLTVAPEMVINKRRSNTSDWNVSYGNFSKSMFLDTSDDDSVVGASYVTSPTTTSFSLSNNAFNTSGSTYVAYLFATCPGVSKVGSYTGNGTTQTIDCGFGAGGARFVLIKRTDASGDWYVYDTARGMTVLTDPYLLLNSAAAEVATLGSVTTVSTGFALNSAILAAINVSAGTYIFLAIA